MNSPISDKKLRQQAREWLLHLESGDASDGDWARFEQWRATSPAHEKVYRQVVGIWQDAALLSHLAQVEPLHKLPPVPLFRWPYLLAAAVLVLAVAVTFQVLLQPSLGPADNYVTQVAEIKDITLADGSIISLGAQSRVSVAFSPEQRHVALTGGEAFFSVTRDPNRPFIVVADGLEVHVVGTKFNVHAGLGQVTVGVAEGRVDIVTAKPGLLPFITGEQRRSRIEAGQKMVSLKESYVQEIKPVDVEKVDSWRSGRLIYENATLREVVADANRYSPRRIVIGSDDIAGLTITAAFRTDKISALVDWLTSVLPLVAKQSSTGQIMLTAACGEVPGSREPAPACIPEGE